ARPPRSPTASSAPISSTAATTPSSSRASRATGSISTSTTTAWSCGTPSPTSARTPGRRRTRSAKTSGCAATSSPATRSGRRRGGEVCARFGAIQGDYGHVASKNGVGAVMGKKKLKAVAIVKGTKALRANDPLGLVRAADEIAHDLQSDPSARSLYEYGTLPGV